MTTLQIHLMMAAIGVAVCLTFVGLVSYRHYATFKRTLLGIFAGGLVAMSPFLVSLSGVESEVLLHKSLLLSFAGILTGLLFYILCRWPVKDHSNATIATYDPGRVPVVLAAEDPNKDVPALLRPDATVEGFTTLKLEEETDADPIYDVSENDIENGIFDTPDTLDTLDEDVEDSFDINEAFTSEVDANAGDLAANDDDVAIDNSAIFELTGQHDIPSDVGVPVPDADSPEPDAAEPDAVSSDIPAVEDDVKTSDYDDDVDIDNSMIFELTGQHEIPDDIGVPTPAFDELETTPSRDEKVRGPGTHETQTELLFDTTDLTESLADDAAAFDDAPTSGAIARSLELDTTLQGKLDELDETLSSLDATLDADATASSNDNSTDVSDTDSIVPAVEAQSFDAAESDVHTATEKLITLQRQILEQNQQQQQLIAELKARSAEQLTRQREESSRIRELLKSTTQLTREVTSQQQTLLDVIAQEKASRLKSEASAKNALVIARTAISRLSNAKVASQPNAIRSESD